MKRVRKTVPDGAGSKPELKRTPAMLRLLQLEKDQAARLVEAKDDDDILESSCSSEEVEGPRRRKPAAASRRFGQKRERRFLDTFLLEEAERPGETFLSITAPKSRYPPRKICRICLTTAPYVCVACGSRYCSIHCRDVHKDVACTLR
jgi:hypothetical protein